MIFNLAVGDVDDDGNGASADEDIESLGPMLGAVLQRSSRIDSADVICARLAGPPLLLSLSISVSVTTVTGEAITFLFKLSGSTFEQVGVS